MLKKLYKHEMLSLFRTMFPVCAVVLGLSLVSRLSLLVETENKFLNIMKGASTTAYVLSIIAAFIVATVIVVVRFYRNLLSHEGYLTFTLPFTATQHVVCKLVCGVAVTVVCLIACLASLLILGIGTQTESKLFELIGLAFRTAADRYGTGSVVLLLTEIGVYSILASAQSLLMVYAAMAVGQRFKNRIAGAVICYFCGYMAMEFLLSFFVGLFGAGFSSWFESWIGSGIESVEILLGFLMLISIAFSAVFFLLTRHFLTKKLNLE